MNTIISLVKRAFGLAMRQGYRNRYKGVFARHLAYFAGYSETQMYRILRRMESAGIVQRIGKRKGWKLVENGG